MSTALYISARRWYWSVRLAPAGAVRVGQRRPLAISRLREELQVVLDLPVGDGGAEALPVVDAAAEEGLVELAGQGPLHDFIALDCVERLAQGHGDLREVQALVHQLVDALARRRTRIDPVANAVGAGDLQGGQGQVGVAGRVDAAILVAAGSGTAHQAGAVLPAPGLVDRGPEADVPEALVGIDGRRADGGQGIGVLDQAAQEPEGLLAEAGILVVGIVEDVASLGVDHAEVVVMAAGGDAGEG